MICKFCKKEVGEDMPGHYAGDNCPWLLEAAGPVTEAGRLKEKTFGALSLGQTEEQRRDRSEKWQKIRAGHVPGRKRGGARRKATHLGMPL